METDKRIKELKDRVRELEEENEHLKEAYIQLESYAFRAIREFGASVVRDTRNSADAYKHDIQKYSLQLFKEARKIPTLDGPEK